MNKTVCKSCQSLRSELDAAREQVLKVVRGEFGQICSYCGQGNDDGTTWGELQDHVRNCEKHPLFQANKRIKELEGALKRADKEFQTAFPYGHRHGAFDYIQKTLKGE